MGPTEFRLLEYLLEKPGRVFSRAQLLDGVWGQAAEIDERTVDVHVGRLRKALSRGRERDPIRTVRGTGYAFDETFGKTRDNPHERLQFRPFPANSSADSFDAKIARMRRSFMHAHGIVTSAGIAGRLSL